MPPRVSGKMSLGGFTMDFIIQGLVQAFQLLIKGDKEVLSIALLTLKVSGSAGCTLGLIFCCLAVSRTRVCNRGG